MGKLPEWNQSSRFQTHFHSVSGMARSHWLYGRAARCLTGAAMSSTIDFAFRCSDCTEVLVAEDDPLFRALLRKRLQRWGYSVKIAEDGAAAWRELQLEHHPRLLLLDWMMPGVDGVEICRRIRFLQH